MLEKRPKILVLHSKSGCAFWRLWQPTQAMQKQGLAEVRYVDAREMTSKALTDGLRWCDIVSTSGLMGANEVALIHTWQSLGKKVAIDYDDLHFNVSPFNPAYRYLGTEEVQVKDPTTGDIKDLWKDGRDGFDLKDNKRKFHGYRAILQEADLITTPTLYLKDAMLSISGREDNIRVLPNGIDFKNWKPLDIREKFKDTFRFGWTVSASHGEDWLSIKPALVEFLNKHKDAKFVCMGDTHFDIKSALPKGQVEWYPFSDLWELHYPLRCVMLGLDAGIAPLADLEFNKCKSPLKYAEYTAFGWPTIAQKMTPYSDHIVHGDTGLLADTKENWVSCLEALYKDKSLRTKLRFNALLACKEMFDLEKVAHEWADVYKNLIGEKVNA